MALSTKKREQLLAGMEALACAAGVRISAVIAYAGSDPTVLSAFDEDEYLNILVQALKAELQKDGGEWAVEFKRIDLPHQLEGAAAALEAFRNHFDEDLVKRE